ncbi:MAG: helix-turn-helix domain-containing protein [Sulfurovum sp.]|uniref:helix-turn-helix domain-containing protein n=1 Tax=Sulfurovum sp. TaxID=1969726 RepID=UPI003C79625A
MPDIHKLKFQPGLIVNQEFFDYPAMQESAKNWLFLSRYRFGTGTFYGRHDGVQLSNLQFGHAVRHEGMMFSGLSPSDCLTIVILQKSAGCVCFNDLKMETGDIIIIDDSQPYDFSSSHPTILGVISIAKTLIATEIPWILDTTDKIFKYKNNILSDTVENEWRRVLEEPNLFNNTDEIKEMEGRIIKAIKCSFEGQTGEACHLTEGEKTALEVRSFLLNSLEETMSIQSIAKQFNLSEKTLLNSFRSLFGITPKRFMQILKLNKAHEDLCHADALKTNVSNIAIKWGFCNFGRFSKDYKALFLVLPSETLNSTQATL